REASISDWRMRHPVTGNRRHHHHEGDGRPEHSDGVIEKGFDDWTSFSMRCLRLPCIRSWDSIIWGLLGKLAKELLNWAGSWRRLWRPLVGSPDPCSRPAAEWISLLPWHRIRSLPALQARPPSCSGSDCSDSV